MGTYIGWEADPLASVLLLANVLDFFAVSCVLRIAIKTYTALRFPWAILARRIFSFIGLYGLIRLRFAILVGWMGRSVLCSSGVVMFWGIRLSKWACERCKQG